jgi:hypothetical protein
VTISEQERVVPAVTKSFSKELVLLCEGTEDERFYEKLIKKRGLPDFEIFSVKRINGQTGGLSGFDAAVQAIRPWTSLSIVKRLVLAADHEPGVLRLLKSVLKRYGFDSPKRAGDIQFTTNLGKPSTAIILLPLKKHGDLETLCLPILYEKWRRCRGCVTKYLQSTGAAQWQRSNRDKARIHAIIAGFNKRDPEKTLRDCFSSDLIDLKHDTFNELANLLTRLGTDRL